MELATLYKRVIGLDVHQAQITACALIEEADGATHIERRQSGAFKRDRRALAEWVASLAPDCVVMESTGIYWKSPYAALEAARIRAQVVNAGMSRTFRDARPMWATRKRADKALDQGARDFYHVGFLERDGKIFVAP